MNEKVATDEECNHVEDPVERGLQRLAPDPKEYAQIVRKVDWHIIPIIFVTYTLSFLDKVTVNYANVMGLSTDLGMTGNQFSNMATLFFVAYAVAEIPQGYLLQKYPVSLVLGANVFLWGILVACIAATQNYGSILALRMLLGCVEAAISPALTLTTTMWYTKQQSAPRYGLWYCGLGAGIMLGGLISFGAQHGPRTGFSGWRIMMVVIGLSNMVVAVFILLFLPRSVESVKFLNAQEKDSLHRMLLLDQAGTGDKIFKAKGVWEAFADLQVWLLCLQTILVNMSSGVITAYSATLIKGWGYSSKQAALLNMPTGAVSMVSILTATFAVGRGYPRWVLTLIFLVPAILGAGLMSFAPGNNQAAKLAGIYLYNAITSGMALIYSWIGVNTAGYSKKVAANGMIAAAFAVGNIISET